ncbi:MAG: hypothetical protein AMXMBFR64_19670 [Myxococcales bacterium]
MTKLGHGAGQGAAGRSNTVVPSEHVLIGDDDLGLGAALLQALQHFDEGPAAPPPTPALPAPTPAPDPAVHQELETTRQRLDKANGRIEDLRRQADRQRGESERFGNERLLRALLPSVDNLERAIEAASRGSGEARALLEGVRMVHRQILQDLAQFGLTSFDSVGEPFDPARHEAVQQVSNDRYPPGVVVAEFSRGYLLHDRLLRPARVAVNAGAPVRPVPPDHQLPEGFEPVLDP